MEDTVLMLGRFQPFTVKDLDTAKEIHRSTGRRVTLAYVRAHQGYENTPFKSATVRKMLNRIVDSYPDIFCSVVCFERWDSCDMQSRLSKDGFQVFGSIKTDHNEIKTAVTRLALSLGCEDEFRRTVPEPIWSMYAELREEISIYRKGK